MTHEFQLTKMRIIDASPNAVGNRLRACFDVLIGGLRIGGFLLIEKEDGRVIACGPHGKTPQGHKASVVVVDQRMAEEMTNRATKLYAGFTGRELPAYQPKEAV